MTIPALLLGIILSTFYGSLFHLWRNGGFGRFLFFVLLSWGGFWLGHFFANWTGWTFLTIGPLHLGMATVICFFFLVLGNWLNIPIRKNTGVG